MIKFWKISRRNAFLSATMLIAFMASLFISSAQEMHILPYIGAERTIDLKNVQKLTFSGNSLIVNLVSGGVDANTISFVRKVYFTNAPLGVSESSNESTAWEMEIYPIPAGETLYLKTPPPAPAEAEIYNIFGSAVLQRQVSPGMASIDISALPAGSYVIKINNRIKSFIKL